MLAKSLTLPLTLDPNTCFCASSLDFGSVALKSPVINVNESKYIPANFIRRSCRPIYGSRRWELNSTAQIDNALLSDEDRKSWDACRQALSTFEFGLEEEDEILGKAFGYIRSPYWSEERKKEVPRLDVVNEVLNYLRSLNLTDDDIQKVLKKFPEVLGCNLEEEMKNNVKTLEKDWGIEGKSLRNLLLRNPKVLGYNIDCKGDCMAQCTRCWVRF
ncbi:hypothetical protein M9H77_18130 [Catharanthus roseus]|uniref:Uncharacterized protein n=1 Tax=Catharanthus roseus TaxID=4058 RepID=A0ACC0B6L6_CATRO|nr:hypothetical protein M9H77_18130 [Catharanthus roseus]